MLSLSSSCRAGSTDIPDPLPPLLRIVHRFWQVLRATSGIFTELLFVGSSWSSCFCLAIWGGPKSTSLMRSYLPLQQCSARLVRLTLIVSWWVVSGGTIGALWGVAFRTCSLLLAAFLCSCRLAFSPAV